MASKSLQECLMCTLKPKLQFLNAINESFNTNNQGSREPRSGVIMRTYTNLQNFNHLMTKEPFPAPFKK
jgi:hypothetical protein